MAEQASTTLESIIHGHHICKQIWWPLIGEILTLEREEGNNNHDKFAVSLLKDATVVDHNYTHVHCNMVINTCFSFTKPTYQHT